jgi:hypothetical protein
MEVQHWPYILKLVETLCGFTLGLLAMVYAAKHFHTVGRGIKDVVLTLIEWGRDYSLRPRSTKREVEAALPTRFSVRDRKAVRKPVQNPAGDHQPMRAYQVSSN